MGQSLGTGERAGRVGCAGKGDCERLCFGTPFKPSSTFFGLSSAVADIFTEGRFGFQTPPTAVCSLVGVNEGTRGEPPREPRPRPQCGSRLSCP